MRYWLIRGANGDRWVWAGSIISARQRYASEFGILNIGDTVYLGQSGEGLPTGVDGIGGPEAGDGVDGGADGGATEVTPPAAPPPAGSNEPGRPLSDESQFAAFLRELNTREIPQGRGRRILERRFQPAQSAFFGEDFLRGLRDPSQDVIGQPLFEQFLETVPQGFMGLGGRARSALGSLSAAALASRGASPTAGGGLTNEQLVNLGQLTDPNIANQESRDLAAQLVGLARTGATSAFAPIIGNRLFSGSEFQPGNLLAQFGAQTGTAGTGDFVNFVRRRFGQPVGTF